MPFALHANLNANKNLVIEMGSKQNERHKFHLDLQMFGSLADALTNFFIVAGQPVGKTVCPIVSHFPEAIIDRTDDW